MIERVDVVTGGASATYRSDAMAGVVNFILRRNFEGVEVNAQYGLNQHDNHNGYVQGLEQTAGINGPTGSTMNGYRRDLSLVVGSNSPDGKGNVTGYFVYHNQDPTVGAKYDYGDCEFVKADCEGSPSSNQIIFPGKNALPNGYAVVGNQFLPWPAAGQVPAQYFNSSAYEFLQRQDTRYQGGFLSHYDVNDHVKPYLDFSFMDDRSSASVAPSGLFEGDNVYSADGSGNWVISCTNNLSAQQLQVIQNNGQCLNGASTWNATIGRRDAEGGGRTSLFDHNNYRVVGGATGEVVDGWTYDAYAQYYYTTLYNSNSNYFSIAGINNALLNGTYNLFQQGGITQQQVQGLYESGTAYGTDTEKIWHADFTGDLSKYGAVSPWAHDGVGINLGWEERHESQTYSPDQAELSGDLAGFGGAAPAIDAGYKVSEGFIEARLPIAQDLPLVQDLTLDGGYRFSNYSTAGTTNTYKLELQYAPVKDVRLRGSFDRAVRAPNLIELYNPQSYGQTSVVTSDPCAGPNPTASLAACERAAGGVNMAALYGSIQDCKSSQCGQVVGGNPDLKPEVAMTWSLGASFTPEMLPNFNATVDYYHIAISGEIGSVPASVILNDCLTSGVYCNQIVRTSTGQLFGNSVGSGGYILQTDINTARVLVSGIDFGMNYKYSLNQWGTLSASFNGTWVQHNQTTLYSGAPTYDCAGLFGTSCSNGVNPHWRHTMRVSWNTPWRTDLSVLWRFIGSSTYDNNSTQQLLFGAENSGAANPNFQSIGSYNYFDVTLTAHPVDNIDVRFGVTNVLDKDPPFLPTQVTGALQSNTFLQYDQLGREMFLSVTAKF
jgi:outer membrane receptor protein involved in Fe transport